MGPGGIGVDAALALLAAASAAFLAAPVLRARLVLRAADRAAAPALPDGGLGPDALGYLAGGPARSAEVALVRLALSGQIRRNGDGTVTAHPAASSTAPGPQESAVLSAAAAGGAAPGPVLRTAAGVAPGGLVSRLTASGLLLEAPADAALQARHRALRRLWIPAASAAAALAAGLAAQQGDAGVRTGPLAALVLLGLLALWWMAERSAAPPVPRSSAAEEALAAARTALEESAAEPLTVGEALQSTALLGLAGLVGQAVDASAFGDGAPPAPGAYPWPVAAAGTVGFADLVQIAVDAGAPPTG
ncbi:TIGR04222 domain-containing membrane protein [Nocardiopsis coralliicola]